MKIVELILDEELEFNGIEAISIVENPAIQSNFVALKDHEIKLAEMDSEKRILLGAILNPNKPILRKGDKEDYYIFFSKDTVEKASQMYLKDGNQNNTSLEHEYKLRGLTLVESWIVQDEVHDKSRMYKNTKDVPLGTWMGAIKVNDDAVWDKYVKEGSVKGFSIEGYFADKMDRPKESLNDLQKELDEQEALERLSVIKDLLLKKEIKLETYNDYPDSVKNNAQKGIDLNEKVDNKCATQVGKIRAQQLAKGENISVDTIKRMYSFLSRAMVNFDESDNEACGTISVYLWGGKAGLAYSRSKLKELGEIEMESMIIDDKRAVIDDRLAYSTLEMAIKVAADIGCEGYHTHEYEGKTWYMPCEKHSETPSAMNEQEFKKYKCPPGYKKDYKKHKCVKMSEEELAEVGPRGGIRPSKKAPKSDTPNRSPKGKGTAKGDAKTSRGAKVDKATEATLKKKSDDFNERYKKKLGYGTSVGQLKTVYQRGLGAFNTSHSPRIKSAKAWAMARVNAYMYLVKNGRPQNAKYKGDNDLLPKGHPKSDK